MLIESFSNSSQLSVAKLMLSFILLMHEIF
jgi:hypothetical protein